LILWIESSASVKALSIVTAGKRHIDVVLEGRAPHGPDAGPIWATAPDEVAATGAVICR
jgi:hypothetical protein